MLTLPAECAPAILAFAPLFSKRVWPTAEALVIGAILAPAQRTVTAVLRVLGLAEHPQFQNFHRLLNRDRWSPLAGARLLLGQLIDSFVPDGPVLVALDSTLERRRGAKIRAKGVYYDAVRSSRSHFAKSTGLRWLCLLLLEQMPFTQRCWALPVLTALCPSERYNLSIGHRQKKLTTGGDSSCSRSTDGYRIAR